MASIIGSRCKNCFVLSLSREKQRLFCQFNDIINDQLQHPLSDDGRKRFGHEGKIINTSIKARIILLCVFFLFLSGCAAHSPLIKATKEGDTVAMEKLLRKGASINESDESGYTPLMYAIWSGSVETVNVLIHQGADINKRDKEGYTPLLWASSYGYLEMAKRLIDKGADVNARSNDQNSPLLLALAANNPELSMLLINKGADTNVVDRNGTTPLIQAAINGYYEIARLLMAKGADLFAADSSGYKASDYVKFSLKTGKRVLKPGDYERNLDFLNLIKKAENDQIMAGQMNTRNPKMAGIYSIAHKVGRCINPNVNYDVFISDKEEPNAWVNVSGHITFTKGALKNFDDDTLTFMAAHEIAHDKLGHVAKKIAVSSTITGAMIVANALLPGVGLLNHIINPTITNNYSKTQEYDADKLASEFCTKCFGMTIEEQVVTMQKIERISKSSGGGFWATHPSWHDRITNINGAIKSPVPPMEAVQSQKYNGATGIELMNGDIIEGQILNVSANAVIIRTNDGKVSSYSFEKEVRGFVK